MHVGFITVEYPHEKFMGSVAGIGSFTKNLAEQLVSTNHQVSIFIYSQKNNEVVTENGVTIYFVKKKTFKGFTWWTNRRYFNNYVNQIIKEKGIDIIESPEWGGFTAFMKFSCPLVLRLHGSDTYFCQLEKRPSKGKNRFFEKKALKAADAIVGVSSFVTDKTKSIFGIQKEIHVIHNAIDVEKFVPNHQQVKKNRLLYFGTIIRKKGVIPLSKMFNKLIEQGDFELVFLGRDATDMHTGGSTLDLCLAEMSEKAKSHFSHVKAVPYHEVQGIIQQSDIVLLPSFAEAFPMTWLEAMALEKKMITSNIGWANELMIDGETGYMVDPNNTEMFVKRVLAISQDEEKALEMGKQARNRIATSFNQKIKTQENINFFQSVIDEYRA